MKKFLLKNWKIILAIFYVLLPTDFLPDFLPALGFSDDILILLGTLILSYLEYRREKIKAEKDAKNNIVDGELVDK